MLKRAVFTRKKWY